MIQKFKRGNKVRILFGHPMWGAGTDVEDISPEEVGKEAIIQYSYADQYGGTNRKDYSIVFCDTGNSMAWKSEEQMELIEEGGEHLFAQAAENRERRSAEATDLKVIVREWDEKQGNYGSETVIFLMKKIGLTSPFEKTGEFYHLLQSWYMVYPALDRIVKIKTQEDLLEFLNPGAPPEYVEKVITFWNEVKAIQASSSPAA